MLDKVLKFFAEEVNGYLRTRTGLVDDVVALSAIVNENGKYVIKEDTVGITMINIEQENTIKNQLPDTIYSNGQHVVIEPELRINIYLMFSANFKLYDQALKYISLILTYFQSHPLFVAAEFPAMDEQLERLTVELQALNYDQLNQIWAFIGAKQLPSAVYKVRVVSIQDIAQDEIRPPIQQVNTDIGGL